MYNEIFSKISAFTTIEIKAMKYYDFRNLCMQSFWDWRLIKFCRKNTWHLYFTFNLITACCIKTIRRYTNGNPIPQQIGMISNAINVAWLSPHIFFFLRCYMLSKWIPLWQVKRWREALSFKPCLLISKMFHEKQNSNRKQQTKQTPSHSISLEEKVKRWSQIEKFFF